MKKTLKLQKIFFSNFCDFSCNMQKKAPTPKKITANIFSTKIYSRVNILLLKFAEQNTVLRIHASSMTT